jgi:hypothetical protein
MGCLNWILNSPAIKLNLYHIPTRRLHRLLNSGWDFTSFAATEAHFTFTITHDRKGSKTENTTALYHFGYTVNLNQLLLKVAVLLLLFLIVKSHIFTLEFQSGFTSSIGQGLDAAVIPKSTAIKRYRYNTRFFSALSDQLANFLCRRNITGSTTSKIRV